jgi:N-acetylglucosaminyl-diphospho-decaprenol L-rhamnosyltransferase
MPSEVGNPVRAAALGPDARPADPDVRVQAVVVAYNSARTLAGCVAPLAALDWVDVTVVDNASPDESLAAVAHLPIDTVRADDNRGFAAGCNIGIARSRDPYVLLVNPDTRMTSADLAALSDVLTRQPDVAIVAPRLLQDDGTLAQSQFRFPRRRST